MNTEQKHWAFAARLLDMHGDAIADFIEQRIDCLTDLDNQDGLRFWHDIASKIAQLTGPADSSKL